MKKGDYELIKQINRRLILSSVRNQQPVSRAALSRELGLSKSTVSGIVDEFIKKKLIFEKGHGESTKEGGRKGIQLFFNPKSSFGIGVDIGGTKILLVVTDLDGEVIYREEHPTERNPKKIVELIYNFIDRSNTPLNLISAMGIGVPSIINTKEGIVVDSPALKWKEFRFLEFLKGNFDFPCFLNNDVNCAMYGELRFGAGRDCSDLLFIAIGTGVGSAVYANGQIVEGATFSAGEIGYLVDKSDIENGYQRVPGEFGAFENKTSGTALSKYGMNPKELFEQYYQGDKRAHEAIKDFTLNIAIAIANASCLLNSSKVIIGGGVSRSMEGIIQHIQGLANQWTPFFVEIESSQFQTDAGAIGAVAYAFEMLESL
ncbi:ROK family transcriptional regulator [Bacillus sp. SCS-153A]|uniref:ROK family transcriptional regulator n=1 Tax=Rossellomorea sedimentorum TaxID=3115294 RepID=UPI003905B55A